jgi:hypothetical protein
MDFSCDDPGAIDSLLNGISKAAVHVPREFQKRVSAGSGGGSGYGTAKTRGKDYRIGFVCESRRGPQRPSRNSCPTTRSTARARATQRPAGSASLSEGSSENRCSDAGMLSGVSARVVCGGVARFSIGLQYACKIVAGHPPHARSASSSFPACSRSGGRKEELSDLPSAFEGKDSSRRAELPRRAALVSVHRQ